MPHDLEQQGDVCRLIGFDPRLAQGFDPGGGLNKRPLALGEGLAWPLRVAFGIFLGEGSINHLLQLFHGTHFLFGEPAAATLHDEEVARLACRFN